MSNVNTNVNINVNTNVNSNVRGTVALLAYIDFETRSDLDLRVVGMWNYARGKHTAPWCLSWAIGDEAPRLWPVDSIEPLHAHIAAGGKIVAHNAAFEIAIWNEIMAPRYGWPALPVEQCICSMACGLSMGLPAGLDAAASALRLSHRKDGLGHAIMLRYCRPWRTEPLRWMDECPRFRQGGQLFTGVEGLGRLHDYCKQDVLVEREIYKRLFPLTPNERAVWELDYRINQRGVQVDVATSRAAVGMIGKVKGALDERMAVLTSGAVRTCSALIALKEWTGALLGKDVDALDKQAVTDLIAELSGRERGPAQEQVLQALKLRQEAGKASTAKYEVICTQADEQGRLHGLYQYHGAATGRWAGRQPQIHNLPRKMPAPAVIEEVSRLTRLGDFRQIDVLYGPPLSLLSASLRSIFTAPEGRILVGGDWSNVEGRGQAWFAGEEWKLRAFVAADEKRGPGLYELAYSRMFGVPVESVKNPSEERQIGKVSELAFGYGGGVGSFRLMGEVYGVKVADSKADEFKHAWRQAHPRITAVWRAVEQAALNAMLDNGVVYGCGAAGRQAFFLRHEDHLWCKLPSGRRICYPYARVLHDRFKDELTYMKVPDPNKPEKQIDDPANSQHFARVVTWGGTLFNNIVQGFSADLLRHAMLMLDKEGFNIVIHTHDDINSDESEEQAEARRARMETVMRTPPGWATGFPLHAVCKVMRRYGK